ncbi:MAG: GntR family transcriptional regulator, partial [Treponema sp.]|nr:GntR family transcriptional regulator [Treponema sp.]
MGRITSGEAVQKNTPLMIYRELKAEILDLTLPPGAVISENSICERFSVSRTPVRSAFQRLSDTRFIKIIPYKEITVTLLNLSQIKQMIFMRLAIESMIIRNFIDTMDPFVIEKMRYFMRTQTLLLKTNFTPRDFFDNDSGFHR